MQSRLRISEEDTKSFLGLPLFLQPPEWISMPLIMIFILQFLFLIIVSLMLPLLFRHLFLNNENNYERIVEFTYDSCKADDDYYGTVCSFLSTNINLIEDEFYFKKNVPYSITLNLVLADSKRNRKISSFITSISLLNNTKDNNILRLKRVVNLKWSWFKSTLIWWRNFFFYPLYLVGIFEDNIISVDMLFTNKFITNDSNFIVNNIFIQIESRQVEVENAKVSIIPYRTLLQSLLFEFPIISYCVLFFIFSTLLFILFSFIWIKKINNTRTNFYNSKLYAKNCTKSICEEKDDLEIIQLKFKDKFQNLLSIDNDLKIPSPPNCEMHKYSNLDSIPGWKTENNVQCKKIGENILRKRKISKDKI